MRPPIPPSSTSTLRPPVISITNGTFYRHHPNTASTGTHIPHPHNHNPALFRNLNFTLPSATDPPAHWYVIGPSLSGKTTFLQLLQGRHLCFPPTARRYPFFSTDAVPPRLRGVVDRAIRYVGFSDGDGSLGGGNVAKSAYLSARYESRRESTDFSLRDFLLGNTSLNAFVSRDGNANDDDNAIDAALLARVVRDLRLADLLDLPVAFLSNGQGRRARIARALLASPEVLLLDEPFMGLDPPTVAGLSPLLHGLARRASPRLVLSARPQDPIPDWITHLVYLRGDLQVAAMGAKDDVLERLRRYVRGVWGGVEREDESLTLGNLVRVGRTLTVRGVEGEALMGGEEVGGGKLPGEQEVVVETADTAATAAAKARKIGEPVVEMDGCQVQYQGKIALGNWTQTLADGQRKDGLIWTVRRGERWGVFGPNGSGKTTVVSLLCSDHPQTYSLPIRLFGRSRLPEPGSGELPLTFWDIQARVGHSSPEIHQHMPRSLSVRQVLENAWADTFRSKPVLDADAHARVDACLRWFDAELNPAAGAEAADGDGDGDGDGENGLQWADYYRFGELSFSAQRVALFLRAMIKGTDIVVLDEACSGMDDGVRDRCLLFLEHGEAKQYATANAETDTDTTKSGEVAKRIVDSEAAKKGEVRVPGLSDRQALICISHVREEIPPCVREWICLPEANSGQPARFGVADAPMARDEKSWRAIWGM